jgi:hypothetical protein
MKQTFFLVEDNKVLDKVFTYSQEDAILIFKRDRGWVFSDRCEVISEIDYVTKKLDIEDMYKALKEA